MSHWYSPIDGSLFDRVEYKDANRKGQYRDATLADARPLGLLPSVTTILTLLSREGINKYRVNQAIKVTLGQTINNPIETGQRLALFPRDLNRELVAKSEEYVNWTADFGTSVHWHISRKLFNKPVGFDPETILYSLMPNAEEVADGFLDWFPNNGYEFELSEHRFVRPDLGYAGSVDLIGTHYGQPCIVDVKTQSLPINFYSPEYPLQLAGYDSAMGDCCIHCGLPESPDGEHDPRHDNKEHYEVIISGYPRERISIILNRDRPGEVHQKLWVDKNSDVATTNARWDRVWMQLTELWFSLNRYDPRKGKDALIDPEN